MFRSNFLRKCIYAEKNLTCKTDVPQVWTDMFAQHNSPWLMHGLYMLRGCQGAECEFDRAEPGELKRTTLGQAICWIRLCNLEGAWHPSACPGFKPRHRCRVANTHKVVFWFFFPSCLTPLIRLMKRIWVCEVGVFLRVGRSPSLGCLILQIAAVWL